MKLWKFIGLVVLAAVVIWVGYTIFGRLTKSDLGGPGGEGRVVKAKLGEMAVTVNASGSVAGPRQAQLSFESAGTISELPAKVGTTVQKGQVLARLEAASLERAVRQAEAASRTAQINLEKARNPFRIVQAEAAVVQAQAAFETARVNLEKARLDWEIAVFVAQIALKTAQDNLGDTEINAMATVRNAGVALENARLDLVVITETHTKALREIQEILDDEEEDYTDLFEAHYGNIPSQEAIYMSLLKQTGRQDKLIHQTVKDAYKSLLDIKSDFDIDNAQAAKAVADAENDVAKAEDNLENAQQDAADLLAGTRAIAVEIKEIEVKKAQAALDRVQAEFAGPEDGSAPLDVKIHEGTVASTQAALRKAQAELDDLKGKFGALDIELKELLLSNAQIALDNALENLGKAAIVAPFNGIVASAGHKVGNRVGAGVVIVQVIDTAEFEVKATVDELDVNQVTVGQAVQVSLDAIPDALLEGTVKSISPVAQTKPGVISYEAVITIPDPGRYALKDGMTTSNEIVVATRENALLVPSKAVSQNGTEGTVTVLVDGKPQERAVRTGLSQDGQIEILEGLAQGEKVLVTE